MRVCCDCEKPISYKATRCRSCSKLHAPSGVKVRSLAERLWSRVEERGECLIWTGCLTRHGYGQIGRGSREAGLVETHVAAWELVFGPVPPGKELHHTCFTPACVSLRHLRALTPIEHKAAHVAAKTTCKYGHPLDGKGAVGSDGKVLRYRYCKTCKRGWSKAYYQRTKAPT